MATCPQCGGFLDQQHRCRRVWRLRLRVWTRIALGGVGGAGLGIVAMAVLFGSASWPAILLSVAVGALITRSFLIGPPTSD
jgi:hypothetical protein